jgi:hypothetical protein
MPIPEMVHISFLTGTQAELLYALQAAVTNASFTTQRVISAPTTMQRAIIPAGFFYDGGLAMLVEARGTVANAATAATFANVLAWDPVPGTIGSAIASFPALAPAASTTCSWELEAWIVAYAVGGAGLTLQCNGKWKQSVVATAIFSTANTEAMFRTQLTGLDSEALAAIELWSTCSASNAGATITVEQFNVFGLN